MNSILNHPQDDSDTESTAIFIDESVTEKVNSLSEITRLIDPDKMEEIVAELLAVPVRGEHRNSRMNLDNAINGCREIRIRGFSKASKARPEILVRRVTECCIENSRLLISILRLWQEIRTSLSQSLSQQLQKLSVPGATLDLREACSFSYIWDQQLWDAQIKSFSQQLAGAESGDETDGQKTDPEIGLMLALVSGGIPAYPGEKEAASIKAEELQGILSWLYGLYHSSPFDPVWMDLDFFIDALSELNEQKREDIVKESLKLGTERTRKFIDDHTEVLDYLEFDTAILSSILDEHPEAVIQVMEDLGELETQLERYGEILPLGASITREKERAVERINLGQEILEKLARWMDKLQEKVQEVEDFRLAVREQAKAAIVVAEEESGAEDLSLQELQENLRLEKSRSSDLKARYDTQGDKLRRLKKTLNMERKAKEKLTEEVAQLKARPGQPELTGQDDTRHDKYSDPDAYCIRYHPHNLENVKNVKDALSLAQRTFTDELLLALNSRSDDNTAFAKPQEVFAALAWLATDYREKMLKPDSGTELNDSLRRVCSNWFYVPRQAPTTKGKFSDWYETKVNGSVFELYEHIGRGRSHNIKSTIRIAFAWSREDARVVIGYIGRHQKTIQG